MNDELTILIGFYFLIGLGTGMFGAIGYAERGEKSRSTFVWPLIWPIIWFMLIFVYFTNRHLAKCAWCGKVVASGRKEDLDIWREHYVDECQGHPLKERLVNERNHHKITRRTAEWRMEGTMKVISALRMALRPTTPSDILLAEKLLDDIDSGNFAWNPPTKESKSDD